VPDMPPSEVCFVELFELDHVCEILREYAHAFKDDPYLDGAPFRATNGCLGLLVERIKTQEQWHRKKSELLFPLGAFDRSYLAEEYQSAQWLAAFVMYHPAELPENLDGLIICLHRVMILANLSEEQLAAAVHQASVKGLAAAAARADQVKKRAFLAWAKPLVDSGVDVKNVRELELSPGFQNEWSKMADTTLKDWANAAGFNLRKGRPKKT